ncbi:Eukaryotic translation initiation factor 4 gamma 2 [Armadillidium vulgare]|nr:Eukaryotic translation initiation factor 4 gamma 2 [Armadillidium vulgare]
MYAQLCKKLSEEAPNFDPPDGPCTFNNYLLSKCQEEFERRRRASELWERPDNQPLTPEEEEQRSAARRKMVGNLRFIGELGKLEIINQSILHNCIQQLLERKRQRTIADLAEDLECLCQIMRTCGKYLMDQYFERIGQLSMSPELPSRIRFMLQDVLDLRAATWVPRKVAQVDGPRTIQQVREEAARDLGIYIPPPNAQGPPRSSGPISPLSSVLPPFFPQGCGSRTGMEDVFGMPPLGAVTLGTGPGVISSQPDKFSYETNGYSNNPNNRDAGFRQRQQSSGNFSSNNFYQNKHFNIQSFNRQNNQNNQQANYSNAANKELPPRFMKMFTQSRGSANPSAGDELSLRPTTSMLPKTKVSGILPTSAQQGNYSASQDLFVTQQPQPPNQKPAPPLMHKEPPILIKQASNEKSKSNKKDKGPTKDEYLKRLHNVLESLYNGQNVSDVVESYRGIKIPDKFLSHAVYSILHSVLKSETKVEFGSQLLRQLRSEGILNTDKLMDAIKQIMDQLDDLGNEIPRVKSNLASLLGPLIAGGVLSLVEVMEPLEGGNNFPMFLLILQTLHKNEGKTWLITAYNESKVNLMNLLAEKDRTKEKLADLLEETELSFLYPLLRIQADLWKSLTADPSPQVFYKYIKDNLDPEHHTAPSFINALVTVIVKYVASETTMAHDPNLAVAPEKSVTEQEKELLGRYKPVLQAFLHDQMKLQVIAIYALQVNQWLTWLQETEEDEEDEEED